MYVNGRLLAEPTPVHPTDRAKKPLMFGYNIPSASLTADGCKSQAILIIWSHALVRKPELAAVLSTMLNSTDPQYADVAAAGKHMGFETAARLRRHLFGHGPHFEGKWYYCGEERTRSPRLDDIILGLGCQRIKLTKTYGDILRRHGLVPTAEEEEHRRFEAAPRHVAIPDTDFAVGVWRLLRACMRACPATNGLSIRLAEAGQLPLRVFFSEDDGVFVIHERWLHRESAVEELGLPDAVKAIDIVFHTVKQLFRMALKQMPDDAAAAERRRESEIRCAEQRLLDYWRLAAWFMDAYANSKLTILGENSEHSGRLHVLARSPSFGDPELELQCHLGSRCSHLHESILIADDGG
jgi:hypothetical protein